MNFLRILDPGSHSKKRGAIISLAQYASLIALLAVVISLTDAKAILGAMSEFSFRALMGALVLQILIIVLLSYRFVILLKSQGLAAISTLSVCRMTFGATLANLLLPTSILGDAGRVWLIRKQGVDTKSALKIGVSDRLVGLVALTLASVAGAVAVPMLVPGGFLASALILFLILSATLYFSLPRTSPGRGPFVFVWSILGLSILGHLIATAIAYLLIHSTGLSVSPVGLLAIFPAILLAAALPLSVGGWGNREIAAMLCLPLIGVEQNVAVAISITFGLTQVAAAMAGFTFLGIFDRRPAR
jgi:hypothetical protein